MDRLNAIQLLKTASGLILSQKNFAIYKEIRYKEGNSLLNRVGIDTNQILGGDFSDSDEVLKGGRLSGSLSFLSGVASFVLNTEPIDAEISQSATIMQHPLEIDTKANYKSGEGLNSVQNFISDHKIILPVPITLRMAFPKMLYQSVHNELESLFYTSTLLAIVTRAKVYRRMIISSFKHKEDPDTIDRMIYTINFSEIQGSFPKRQVVSSPDDKSRS